MLGGVSLAVTSVGLYFYLQSRKKRQELEKSSSLIQNTAPRNPKLLSISQVKSFLDTKNDEVEPILEAPIKQFEVTRVETQPTSSSRQPTQAELDQKYEREYADWLAKKQAWDLKEEQRVREINNQREAEYQRQVNEIERKKQLELDRQRQVELERQKAVLDRQRQEEVNRQRQAEIERQQQADFDKRQKQIELDRQRQASASRPTQQASSQMPTTSTGDGQAVPNPSGNRSYGNITLLDYVVDPSTPLVPMTRKYKDYGDLTIYLKRAPALGLAQNPQQNAKQIAALLGSNANKYNPTDAEVTKLAYVLSRERSSGADLGQGRMSPINVQRERAAILWSIINAIPGYIKHYGYSKAPHTIDEVLARGTEYLNYAENPRMSDFNEMNEQLRPDNRNLDPLDFRTFVRAFFDGQFNNEIGNSTNWVHSKVKKWSFFVIPPDAKFSNGQTVKSKCKTSYGCTSSEDVFIFLPNGIFGRAFVKP